MEMGHNLIIEIEKFTNSISTFSYSAVAPSGSRRWTSRIEEIYTSVYISPHPHPSWSSPTVVVEVDASDTGVGAVLSQCSGADQKLHPCAFFSRELSPTKRNYDVGDRELLAVKLALEERRHWLESLEQPVVVWTNRKNLAYIQTAKKLNSHLARWSLFSSCFIAFVASSSPTVQSPITWSLMHCHNNTTGMIPTLNLITSCHSPV